MIFALLLTACVPLTAAEFTDRWLEVDGVLPAGELGGCPDCVECIRLNPDGPIQRTGIDRSGIGHAEWLVDEWAVVEDGPRVVALDVGGQAWDVTTDGDGYLVDAEGYAFGLLGDCSLPRH